MRIGLALSGGGTRAAVFHLGVLRRLAADDRLGEVVRLSTVSGGSLATAMVFSHSGMAWPTSNDFERSIYPALRTLLTTTSLANIWTLLRHLPTSPHLVVGHRAKLLANLLESRWGVRGRLVDLPDTPDWRINATCYETGKNWRFSRGEMGDWTFGRHATPPFSVAEAAAASAAVPYAVGALRLKLPQEGWYTTNPSNGMRAKQIAISAREVHLWDGGAYENIGLEALYKPGRGMIDCNFILVSDASASLIDPQKTSVWSILKGDLPSPRLFDIASDQIRALRSRMFVDALQSGGVAGALLRLGNSVRGIDRKAGRARPSHEYALYQSDEDAEASLFYPTNLEAIKVHEFDRISRNGFEVADATITAYCPHEFSQSKIWESNISSG